MMFIQKLRGLVLEKVLKLLTDKRGPSKLSLDKGDHDCYYAHFHHKDFPRKLLFDKYDEDTGILHGFMLNEEENKFCFEIQIKFSDLNKITSFSVTHYYNGYILKYDTYAQFLKEWFTSLDKIKLYFYYKPKFWLKLLKFRNKKITFKQRIEVLRLVKDQTIKHHEETTASSFSRNYEFHASDLATSYLGRSWYSHPKHKIAKAQMKVYLDSFVDTGELKLVSNGSKYCMTGKAIKTLELDERDERRHQDSIKIQGFIAVLTLCLVLVGLLQIPTFRLFFDTLLSLLTLLVEILIFNLS